MTDQQLGTLLVAAGWRMSFTYPDGEQEFSNSHDDAVTPNVIRSLVEAAIASERQRSDALRSVLLAIVEQDPVELILDPLWSQRMAKGWLDATRT